jgi:hypothetical protein
LMKDSEGFSALRYANTASYSLPTALDRPRHRLSQNDFAAISGTD